MLFEAHGAPQIHGETARVMRQPVVMERESVLVAEDEHTGVLHQVGFVLDALVHHQIIHGQHLAAVRHVDAQREPFVSIVDRRLERVMVAVFEVFGVVGLVLHLQGVGVGGFAGYALVVVQVLRLGESVSEHVTEVHILADIHLAVGTDLRTVDTGMAHIDELGTDADAGVAERLGLLDAVEHGLQLVDDIVDRVDHREIGVAEESELILDHVAVLGVEAGEVDRSGHGAELIELHIAQFGVVARLRLDVVVRIDPDSAYVLACKFLRDGGVAVSLSERSTEEAGFVDLPVETGTEHGTNRTEPVADLYVGLLVLVVHTVVLEPQSGAQREPVRDSVIVLQIGSQVVRMVRARDIGGVGDMAPVDARRQAYTGLPLFGELIVHIAVIGQFGPRGAVVSQQVHRVAQGILQLSHRTRVAQPVLDQVDTA